MSSGVEAGSGGAMYVIDSDLYAISSIFDSNRAELGGAIALKQSRASWSAANPTPQVLFFFDPFFLSPNVNKNTSNFFTSSSCSFIGNSTFQVNNASQGGALFITEVISARLTNSSAHFIFC
jgi:hypothetical protein